MDQFPLVEEIDAGADFVGRFDRKIPVKVAFWLKPVEADKWYLYVASDSINDQDLDVGYREVSRLANQKSDPYLDPFQIKLIPSKDALAQAALEFQRQFPGQVPLASGPDSEG